MTANIMKADNLILRSTTTATSASVTDAKAVSNRKYVPRDKPVSKNFVPVSQKTPVNDPDNVVENRPRNMLL